MDIFYKGKIFETFESCGAGGGRNPIAEKSDYGFVCERACGDFADTECDSLPRFLAKDANLEIQLRNCRSTIRCISCSRRGRRASRSVGAGAGGVLTNHLKELMLHTDLKRTDRIFISRRAVG